MKLKTLSTTLLMIAAATLFGSHAVAAPSTAISSCGTVINAPGNYFLAQNLACTGSTAVVIAASKVDLDLRGFTIDGGGGSGYGISTSNSQMSSTADLSLCLAVTNIHIHGGTIKGYGRTDETAQGAGIILCSPNPPPGPRRRHVCAGRSHGAEFQRNRDDIDYHGQKQDCKQLRIE